MAEDEDRRGRIVTELPDEVVMGEDWRKRKLSSRLSRHLPLVALTRNAITNYLDSNIHRWRSRLKKSKKVGDREGELMALAFAEAFSVIRRDLFGSADPSKSSFDHVDASGELLPCTCGHAGHHLETCRWTNKTECNCPTYNPCRHTKTKKVGKKQVCKDCGFVQEKGKRRA